MANSVSMHFDAAGVKEFLNDLGNQAEAALRPAAQAGAQVLYDEVLVRVPVGRREFHWFHGTSFRKHGTKYKFPRGTLQRAIYQAFSKDNSGDGKKTYHVAWNQKKAPYGHMVEFGTSKAPAHAFLRPAYDARSSDAAEAMSARWVAEMSK